MDQRAFWLPKRGDNPEDWEDAWAGDRQQGRFAVADGATESAFASSWARSLVERFVQSTDCEPHEWSRWLPDLQREWTDQFQGSDLPWFAEAKLEKGAFATFLGIVVRLMPDASWQWHAAAVGDTCLFHTRGAELVCTFPCVVADQFSNSPFLIGSKTPLEEIQDRRAVTAQGSGWTGDRLWLMTDALAHWCLQEYEAERLPWETMERFLVPGVRDEAFATWIAELRSSAGLKNDDVTLVVLTLGEDPPDSRWR